MKQGFSEKTRVVGSSELITPTTAAAMLGVRPATLTVWRCTKRYPLPYIKVGARRVMYRRSDIETFIAAGAVGE